MFYSSSYGQQIFLGLIKLIDVLYFEIDNTYLSDS